MARIVNVARRVISSAAGQVNGDSIRASGFAISVQYAGPAALGRVEVSNDRFTWSVADDLQGVALTAQGPGVYSVEGIWNWVRGAALTDAGAPNNFDYMFSFYKED